MASMASSTARPPRLNISMSTRNAESTLRASGMPCVEQFPRPRNQFLHQRNVARIEAARHDVVFREAVRRQRFQRNVDAALFQIARHILPEIRELQRRARRVGKLLALGVAIAAQIQHQAADRIRRIAAIIEHVIPGRSSAARSGPGETRSSRSENGSMGMSQRGNGLRAAR